MKRRIGALLAAALLGTMLPSARAAEGTVCVTEAVTGAGRITLTWTDGGADYYEVLRASREHGAYAVVGTAAQPTYTDTGLQSGQVWFYRVRPCWGQGGDVRRGPASAPFGQSCVRVVQTPAEQNPCYRQGRTIRVTGLMLHSVGCAQERGSVFADLWNRPDAEVLVHAVIEPGGTVYQLADWETRCWHCGGSGNDAMIGVEMTEPDELCYVSGDRFTWSGSAREKVLDNYNTAVALFANLCFRYGLDPMTAICSHREGAARGIASGHGDPEHLWQGLGLKLDMDTFRRDVRRMMRGAYRPRTVEDTEGRLVTVTADVLNVRTGPGTGYAIQGALRAGETVTVTAYRDTGGRTWGKLTTGGWICMEYVQG